VLTHSAPDKRNRLSFNPLVRENPQMKHGERQVSPTIDGIRKDHVERYQFVAKRLAKGSRVVDFSCGVGYGSRILADWPEIP
jgi:hypothetical protein